MKRTVMRLTLLLALASAQAACGSGSTPVDDSPSGCGAGEVSCGSCANAGAPPCTICCPSDQPFWCVDGSGNTNCYASESDASGSCLSQVSTCSGS